MKKLLFASALISNICFADIPRIRATRIDRAEVGTIYLAPGLGSMVMFPCLLLEVFIGRSDDLKAQISPNDKKTLLLNLKLNTSLPTNLIARCENERSVMVFDIIPSRSKHQDYIDITNAIGGPRSKNISRTDVSSISGSSSRYIVSKPRLIKSGGSK